MCATSNNSEKKLLKFQDKSHWGFKWVWVWPSTYWPPSFGSCIVGGCNLSLRWSCQNRTGFLQLPLRILPFSSRKSRESDFCPCRWLPSLQEMFLPHVWCLHFMAVLVFQFLTRMAAQHGQSSPTSVRDKHQGRKGKDRVQSLSTCFSYSWITKALEEALGKGWRQF